MDGRGRGVRLVNTSAGRAKSGACREGGDQTVDAGLSLACLCQCMDACPFFSLICTLGAVSTASALQ